MPIVCALLLVCPFAIQEKSPPAPNAPAQSTPASKPGEKADWPKLPAGKQEELLAKLTLFKRASAERAKELVKELRSYGKGAVPVLLMPLEKAEPEWKTRLLALLDEIADSSDTARLLHSADSKTPSIRQYALRRASLFAKPEHAQAFAKFIADSDPENRFYAALGASRAGSVAGLPTLLEMGGARWEEHRKEILSALGGVRGVEATKAIRPLLDAKDDDQVLLGLRLLAGAGDTTMPFFISGFLDSANNRLKEEAVNALRAIVDRAPPLENLSVFDLIDQAKQWKERLKTWKPS